MAKYVEMSAEASIDTKNALGKPPTKAQDKNKEKTK